MWRRVSVFGSHPSRKKRAKDGAPSVVVKRAAKRVSQSSLPGSKHGTWGTLIVEKPPSLGTRATRPSQNWSFPTLKFVPGVRTLAWGSERRLTARAETREYYQAGSRHGHF